MDDWPDCPVRGCHFKICLALNSDRCFVHTPGNKHVKRMKIEAAIEIANDYIRSKNNG